MPTKAPGECNLEMLHNAKKRKRIFSPSVSFYALFANLSNRPPHVRRWNRLLAGALFGLVGISVLALGRFLGAAGARTAAAGSALVVRLLLRLLLGLLFSLFLGLGPVDVDLAVLGLGLLGGFRRFLSLGFFLS